MGQVVEEENGQGRDAHGDDGRIQTLRGPKDADEGCECGEALQHERFADEVHAPVQLVESVQDVDDEAYRFEQEVEDDGEQGAERTRDE